MVSFKCWPSRWDILSVFGFQRAIPAAVMVREMSWDQTPHVMIAHLRLLSGCMMHGCPLSPPIATGGICGCGNHDEYSSVGISDVSSGRVPTPVMGREMLRALLLNKSSHGQWPYVTVPTTYNQQKSKQNYYVFEPIYFHWNTNILVTRLRYFC